jgi:hypothetical protein
VFAENSRCRFADLFIIGGQLFFVVLHLPVTPAAVKLNVR